jgi:hypothetical protein
LAVGMAILKHHLYDIDVVITRTLVYVSLSAVLALVYFGGVTATQAVFTALTGQDELPQLAIVVSTLVIAPLFTPLRRYIQSFIDRRFYRRTRKKSLRPSKTATLLLCARGGGAEACSKGTPQRRATSLVEWLISEHCELACQDRSRV